MKIKGFLRFANAALAAFVFGSFSTAFAQDRVLFQNDELTIAWPESIQYTECAADLKAKAGAACRQLGPDGSQGAVFLTIHNGYELGSLEALQNHIDASEQALANIPRIHVMQSRILNRDPLMGMMEILRNDGTLKDIENLRDGTVRQTSILIPASDLLVQVFIYLPNEDENSVLMLQTLVNTVSQNSVVRVPPVAPQIIPPENKPSGTLELLPKALWIGGIIALIGIVCVSIHTQITRARRRREDQKLQDQLEACSNMSFEEEEGDDNPSG